MIVLNLNILLLLAISGCSANQTLNQTLPSIIKNEYGLTLDSVDTQLPEIIAMLKSLPSKPYVRIVFDYPRKASTYKIAVGKIAEVANVIGQPSDSEYNSKMSVDQYRARFQDYVSTFPNINIWEVCNECNGDWLGKNAIKQAEAAIKVVKNAKKEALYTAYWNTPSCADKNGDWYKWNSANLTSYIKTNITYATLSVYGYDCDGPEPAYNVLDSELSKLQQLFPTSKISIGEFGQQGSLRVMQHYLNYPKKGLGLYWFGKQDLVPMTKPLFKVFGR